MHSKRITPTSYQIDETKEKRRKFNNKPLDLHEDSKSFVNFCLNNLYECIYSGKSLNLFMNSSK